MHEPNPRTFLRRAMRLTDTLPLREPTRFVVITRGRTGSNLLLSLLGSHPWIRVKGEVIGEFSLRQASLKETILEVGPVPYVRQCFKRSDFELAVGIKILYYQVEQSYEDKWGVNGLSDVMDFLRSKQDIKIIHLKRRNRFKCLTSIRVAELTGEYVQTGNHAKEGRTIRVTLAADECENEFRHAYEWEKRYDHVFEGHEMLEVTYESLTADMKGECDRILDFLSLPRWDLTTPMKKQRERSLAEVVDNYDELKAHFAGTEYAWYFE